MTQAKRDGAFTLLEVLTAIAIVAALAALLLPALAAARAAGRRSDCLSRLRQVGQAVLLYGQDYDEGFPPYYDSVTGDRCSGGGLRYGGAGRYWPELVSPYLSGRRGDPRRQARLQDLAAVFVCPESVGPVEQTDRYRLGNITAYGISDHLVNWWTPTGCGGFAARRLPEIAAPAQCVLLAETWDWFSPGHDLPGAALALSPLDRTGAAGGAGVSGAVATLDGRHRARWRKRTLKEAADPRAVNSVFFCDGHVRAVPVSDLTTSARLWSVRNDGQWP